MKRDGWGASVTGTFNYLRFAAVLILAGALTIIAYGAVRGATSVCGDQRSETRPPTHIRVYIGSQDRVVDVPFKLYVARVMMSEWHHVPEELRAAGAVAVKQYGWSRVAHWSGRQHNGHCFHVYAGTADQIYRHSAVPAPDVWDAVNRTWHWRLIGSGGLVHTNYKRGSNVGCAADAGRQLFARSATRCALRGWSAEQILERYYRHREARLIR